MIKGNLLWVFAYNTLTIPLPAAGYITPVLAAIAFSSVFLQQPAVVPVPRGGLA
jgi:Cu+-exporting ATPase